MAVVRSDRAPDYESVGRSSNLFGRATASISWERYRQCKVERVELLSAAGTLGELIELCHSSNLQPLW